VLKDVYLFLDMPAATRREDLKLAALWLEANINSGLCHIKQFLSELIITNDRWGSLGLPHGSRQRLK